MRLNAKYLFGITVAIIIQQLCTYMNLLVPLHGEVAKDLTALSRYIILSREHLDMQMEHLLSLLRVMVLIQVGQTTDVDLELRMVIKLTVPMLGLQARQRSHAEHQFGIILPPIILQQYI